MSEWPCLKCSELPLTTCSALPLRSQHTSMNSLQIHFAADDERRRRLIALVDEVFAEGVDDDAVA